MASKKPRFLELKKLLKPQKSKFRFYFYFLVKFYMNHIKFHIPSIHLYLWVLLYFTENAVKESELCIACSWVENCVQSYLDT